MNILDDLNQIRKIDSKNVAFSISSLAFQIKDSWEKTQAIDFPPNFTEIDNIVVAGMGGSTYGARIVKSLYDGAQLTKVPIELVNNYWLPGYINTNSLVILSSYSGNTEETLACALEALKRNAKIIGITTGGKLADFLKKNNFPGFIFDPIHNPSGQPRVGVGYMVFGLIGIMSKLGFIPVNNKEVEKLIAFLDRQTDILSQDISQTSNHAKQMAFKLQDKIPVIIIADFLEGAAYSIRNPFHETAKQFALYFTIPELNHHLLEGLSFPKDLRKKLYFIFVESDIYDKRNAKRLRLTQDVVSQNNISSDLIKLKGFSALTQTFELIQYGAWITFYLAILHKVDPARIPWVDYFKMKLSQ